MPIQIDRMDTSIEITPPAPDSSGTSDRGPTTVPDPRAQEALREMIGQVMADELDRFLRGRGM